MKVARALGGLFCDDIRVEITGKLTLVGCYTGVMYVQQFPVSLPKVCALVRLVTPIDEPFGNVMLRLLKDDDVLQEAELPLEGQEPRWTAPNLVSAEQGAMQSIHAQFVQAPLQLDGPCTLRVRAEADGKEVRGLSLVVQLLSERPAEEAIRTVMAKAG